MSLVERKTGYLVLGKLRARTTAEVNRCAIPLMQQQPHVVHTNTSGNGTEFHGYAALEAATQADFYFASPNHAWEHHDGRPAIAENVDFKVDPTGLRQPALPGWYPTQSGV